MLHQLGQKRSEDEARAALRTLLGSDVSMMQVGRIVADGKGVVVGGAARGCFRKTPAEQQGAGKSGGVRCVHGSSGFIKQGVGEGTDGAAGGKS